MDPITRAMYAGLGAVSLTKEKAGEIIDELVKRGELNGKDRADMVERLLKEAETQKGELEGKLAVTVQKVMTDMGLPTRKDLQEVVKRLDGVEATVGSMKNEKRGKKA
jgi:polyhydroxyalkanoate synthesis regulator phasin